MGAPVDHLAGQEQFETAISFKDGNSGLAKDLQRAQLRISGKNAAGVAQRNLGGAFRDIDAMCNQISLPRAVADVAKQLFKRVDDERLCRGKTPRAVHAACVFVACRTQGVGRSFKEIAQLSGTSKKHVADCFKVIQRAFDISGGAAAAGEGAGGADDGSTITHPAYDVVVRLCSGLALPPYVQAAAQGVVTRSTEHGLLTGRDPYTVAGACLFFACHLLNQPKSFSEISGISGMAESTLRQAYQCGLAHRAAGLIEQLPLRRSRQGRRHQARRQRRSRRPVAPAAGLVCLSLFASHCTVPTSCRLNRGRALCIPRLGEDHERGSGQTEREDGRTEYSSATLRLVVPARANAAGHQREQIGVGSSGRLRRRRKSGKLPAASLIRQAGTEAGRRLRRRLTIVRRAGLLLHRLTEETELRRLPATVRLRRRLLAVAEAGSAVATSGRKRLLRRRRRNRAGVDGRRRRLRRVARLAVHLRLRAGQEIGERGSVVVAGRTDALLIIVVWWRSATEQAVHRRLSVLGRPWRRRARLTRRSLWSQRCDEDRVTHRELEHVHHAAHALHVRCIGGRTGVGGRR